MKLVVTSQPTGLDERLRESRRPTATSTNIGRVSPTNAGWRLVSLLRAPPGVVSAKTSAATTAAQPTAASAMAAPGSQFLRPVASTTSQQRRSPLFQPVAYRCPELTRI